MTTFFTSDNHFGHTNIIKYTDRPFSSVEEMNETMIRNWNNVVTDEDTIYHLGDFAFSRNPEQFSYRLNGVKILIKGNHDKRLPGGFQEWYPYREVTINKQSIVLFHYAMRVWNRGHYGAWQLYGHSHGSLPDDPNARSLDVGVDCHNFTPISFEQLILIMNKKNFKPIDHHTERK